MKNLKMKSKDIDFAPGNVVFDDFIIDEQKPLFEQVHLLKEDLLQVNYFDKYIIDVGWYPSFEQAGNFKIYVVADGNWECPVLVKECTDIIEVQQYLKESVNLVNKFLLE